MNVKKFLLPACSLLLAAGLLAGCTTATGGSSTPINSNSSATAQGSTNATNTSAGNVTDKDLDASWDAATATTITLNGATATVEGSGAAADGSTVTISAAGTYVVSGTLADGRHSIALVQAVYQSGRKRKTISVRE